MAIYPIETWKRVDETTATFTHEQPGLVITETFRLLGKAEVRTNCFCCSCDDQVGSDVYCRNHGFAGERPCELHGMPGVENDDGVMPKSVQAFARDVE
jgi:hypothetical protein